MNGRVRRRTSCPRARSPPALVSCAAGRAGDQACYDAIALRATGAIAQPTIGWQNRPAYQLAVAVQGHRPR
jgi:hypothetical protein